MALIIHKHSILINKLLKNLIQCCKKSDKTTIELRSDTFTLPTGAMRKAIAEAAVGDDDYKEDPTVNKLEKRAANLMQKEAALFVASGTMGNLISIMLHCDSRGMETILGDQSHILLFQCAQVSQIAGVHKRTVETYPDGTLNLDEIRAKIRGPSTRFPPTGLVCFENTHLHCGGQAFSLDYLNEISKLRKEVEIPFHLDGSRILNAAIYRRVQPSKISEPFDTVCFCLSKGLGAPIGSMICGPASFIHRAIRARKLLGGGMHQVGIIAAAGIYALKNNVDRLEDDHKNARQIAETIADMKSRVISVNPNTVQTNIILAKINENIVKAHDFCERMSKVTPQEKEDLQKSIVVKIAELQKGVIRVVTHINITQKDVSLASVKFKYVIEEYEKQNPK